MENITISRSLRGTLSFLKKSEKKIKLEQRDGDKVLWNIVLFKPLGENRLRVKDQEYDITPNFQAYFTNKKLTTKFLDNVEKETVIDILKNVGIQDNIPKRGFDSARMKDALYNLPKVIGKIRNPPLSSIENVEDSSDPEGQRLPISIPSNAIAFTQDLTSY